MTTSSLICVYEPVWVGKGVLALVDHEKEVLACLKEHSRKLLSKQPLPKELLSRFKATFPESRSYL
jgi:hypothetical protein